MIDEPAEEILEELDGSGRGSKAKLILPWAFAAVVIAYLLWYVPIDEVAAAISEAEVGWFLPLIMGSVVYWFLLDSLAYSYLIPGYLAPCSCGKRATLTHCGSPCHIEIYIHSNIGSDVML